MNFKEFTNNIALSFTTKDEGFSIKKQIGVVVVLTMLVVTLIEVTADTLFLNLGAWLSFALALFGIGAVEKNITAVNETKQKANEISNTPS